MRRQSEWARLREKLKPPGPVVDVHVHPYPVPGITDPSPQQAADFLIAQADRAGISRMILMNLGRTWSNTPSPEACRLANDQGIEVARIAPDRFLPFAYVNPALPEEAIAELDRTVGRGLAFGVKLWVAVRASDDRVIRVVRHAARLGVPVLQHAWIKADGNLPGESTPSDVAALASAVPEAKIIMGHLGGGGLRGIEFVRSASNVFVETGGSDPETGIVEAAVARLGSKRVIFGSDANGRNMAVQLGKVLGAGISDIAKKRILWNNLVGILPASAGIPVPDDDVLAPEDKAKS